MILHIPRLPGSWVLATLLAIAGGAARANEIVEGYRPVFQDCRSASHAPMLAIRRMDVDGQAMILAVDPATLATSLQHDTGWSCTDTDDERQKDTRYGRAIHAATASRPQSTAVIVNGGVLRSNGTGSFLTGDLCPSNRPLDRAFLEGLLKPLPLALAISGTWLTRHRADFQWLRAQEREGALQITWVDHSYDHPYVAGRPLATNFLLSPGVDMRTEILRTEQALIANGETPSVFFRFPGLISNAALMRAMEEYHLVVLGAGAWLAQSPRANPGDVILVHLNGNEPAGLRIFAALQGEGRIPRPFRAIDNLP